tara:strand:+ start:494 stop:763 length:270 start_codon:yes stop_codon:yes gene_type:complete
MAEYKVTTSDHEERCLNFNIVGIQTWIDNAVAAQIQLSQQEIVKLNMEHCNANGISIGVGVTAQVEQAYTLGIVTTAEARNAAAMNPGS